MKFSTIFIAAAVLALPVALSFAGEPSDQRESPEKMFQEGLSLFQNRNFDKAEKLFTRLMALRPNHVPTAYMRGACRLALGAYEEALADFDAVVKAAPAFAKGLAQRGRARLCLERYDDARKDLEEAVALDPSDPGWKSDLEQTKMLLRGSSEFGPGAGFPAIRLKAPAPKGKEPSDTGEAGVIAALISVDRAGRAIAGEGAAKGVVLVFFQGMAVLSERSWLSDLDEYLPELENMGYTAAAVFPDPPETLHELIEGKDLSLPIFSDTQGRAAWKLGILNTRRKDVGEPLPTVFVIDAAGRVVSRRTFLDPARRDPVEKVLKDLAEKTKKDGRGQGD